MARTIIFLAAIMACTDSTVAQVWSPPGATWAYHYAGWGADHREEHRYVGDTLLDGRNARKAITTATGTGPGGQPIAVSGVEYTAIEGGIVWLWTGPLAPVWDTLYWYGADVGDRWWPPMHPANCPPHGMLEVTGTGTATVDGLVLDSWTIATLDGDGAPIGSFELIERIGATPRLPHVSDCSIVIEYFTPSFLCYSDLDIQWPSDADCSIMMATADVSDGRTHWLLSPNPGTAHFTISGIGGGSASLRVLDMQGREVLRAIAIREQDLVRVDALGTGVYLVEVVHNDGARHVMRWQKQ